MHHFHGMAVSGRLRPIVTLCLLLVFLNGCAGLRQKQVSPPPRPSVSRPSVPAPPVTRPPPAAEPPVEERPVVTEPPVEERPLVIEPPAQEPPAQEPPAVVEPPAGYKPVTGRATGVYNQAEEALQAGNFSAAEMLLERALRIEPRNAHYWYTLALAKYRQKQYPQAVQFCLKAESLARTQPELLARNRALLTQAKKAGQIK